MDKTDLIWRRARVLEEKLGNPDGAAACLRGLGPDALSDPDTAAALLRNLRTRRSVARSDADPRTAYRHSPHGRRRSQADRGSLSGKGAAQGRRSETIPRARCTRWSRPNPSHRASPACCRRWRVLHLKRNDFKSFAAALLHQADAQEGQPEQVGILLEAASVFRDQLSDTLQARVCFERAVANHPQSPEALGALASLEAAEGRVEEAIDLYERQLTAQRNAHREGRGVDQPRPRAV